MAAMRMKTPYRCMKSLFMPRQRAKLYGILNSHSVGQQRSLQCVELESRFMPASFTVASYSDPSPGTSDTTTLRYALENLTSGENTITFDSSYFVTSGLPILLNSDLPPITQDVDFVGFSSNYCIIDGSDLFTAITAASSSVTIDMNDMTIRNTAGSGIAVPNGDLDLSGVTITGCTTTGDGGAINIGSGSLLLEGVTLTNNFAVANGGAISTDSATLTISGCVIGGSPSTQNAAGVDGGGISSVTGDVDVTGSTISYCYANGGNGGAINIGSGTANIGGSSLAYCSAGGNGGAISINYGFLAISGSSTISSNKAGGGAAAASGGAIYINIGSITLSSEGDDNIIDDNTASTMTSNIELGTNAIGGAIDIVTIDSVTANYGLAGGSNITVSNYNIAF